MNYCDKIHYSLYVASANDFSSMIDDLLLQLPEKESVVRLLWKKNMSPGVRFSR